MEAEKTVSVWYLAKLRNSCSGERVLMCGGGGLRCSGRWTEKRWARAKVWAVRSCAEWKFLKRWRRSSAVFFDFSVWGRSRPKQKWNKIPVRSLNRILSWKRIRRGAGEEKVGLWEWRYWGKRRKEGRKETQEEEGWKELWEAIVNISFRFSGDSVNVKILCGTTSGRGGRAKCKKKRQVRAVEH